MSKPIKHGLARIIIGYLMLTGKVLPTSAQGTGAAYVSVAAGTDFTFAIQSNGTLWAWGNNADGELGDGTTTSRLQPVAVAEPTGAAPGSRWVRIFPYAPTTPVYGLRSDQTLWQWGASQTRPVPVALAATLPSGATLVDLAFGAEHCLLLYSDGTLLSWGDNFRGQLGIGAAAGTGSVSITAPAPVITPATAAPGTRWTSIEADEKQSFAVRSDGTLWSWGGVYVTYPSTLGHPVTALGCFAPEIVPHPAGAGPGTGWVAVDAGETHTLGLRSDGTLWVWGFDNRGALGQGNTVSVAPAPLQVPVPAGLPAGTRWQHAYAGFETSQAILSDGTFWAWGLNQYGQLGVNSPNYTESLPLQDYNQEVWTQSASGRNHSVALSRGRVYVTGAGSNGQLGLGSGTGRLSFFVRVVGLPLTASAAQNVGFATQVAPNPAVPGDNLAVSLPLAFSSRAEFVNTRGQTVSQSAIITNRLTVPPLAPGIYIVRFYNEKQFLGLGKLSVN